MAFPSLEFLAFLVLFFFAWPLLRRRNTTRWALLVVASVVFYGWWDWRYLGLLAVSGGIDFLAALGMERYSKWKKPLLAASLVGNLGLLATFKYLGFFHAVWNDLAQLVGMTGRVEPLNLILPVGISFYTFQSMSYTIDVYRGQLRPTRNPLHFFAYLSLFPQLVAGPIVRAADLLPQLLRPSVCTPQDRWEGLKLIVFGYFKKVVLADRIACGVDEAFAISSLESAGSYWWVTSALFAAQIYCDFSGYTDIARGLCRWMGLRLGPNFNHPYAATSLSDFWSRWHISLSTWFRDYVYIPLGGSRRGAARTHANLWITMLLSGVWHGAGWTFIAWGALHAALLSAEKLLGWPARLRAIPGGRLLATWVTFALVCCSWIVFRAESLPQAATILASMFNPASWSLAAVGELKESAIYSALLVFALEARAWWRQNEPIAARNTVAPAAWRVPIYQRLAVATLIVACVFFRSDGQPFIYFQF